MLRIYVGCSKEILKYALLSLENQACSELIRESRYGSYTATRKYFSTSHIRKLFRWVCLPHCRGTERSMSSFWASKFTLSKTFILKCSSASLRCLRIACNNLSMCSCTCRRSIVGEPHTLNVRVWDSSF